MYKYISLLLFTAMFTFNSSCTFTKKIKDGSMAFELRQYSVAVDMLSVEYQNANDMNSKARIAYTLGESYWRMGEVKQSLPWYSKAVQHKFGPRAKEKQAFALKHEQNYKEAMQLFRELEREGNNIDLYRREIAICRLANDWVLDKKPKYKADKAYFNSKSADYSPIYLDDHRIFFSSDRDNETSEGVYNWTGREYSDIYMYNEMSGDISHLDPVINSKHNEGTLSFNNDGSVLFFTRCYTETEQDDYCKILTSTYAFGNWSNPKILPFVEEGLNYGHPFWVEKDSVLFFSAELATGQGGFDLYFTSLDRVGEWSVPRSMGPIINTAKDEKFPTIKNDTLFFASDGHAGMGGLDIFYTYINKGKWIRPINMKSPINSGADDFSIVFSPMEGGFEDQGYFSSSRDGGDDIFGFEPIERTTDFAKEIEEPGDKIKSLKMAITVVAEDENGSKDIFPKANIIVNGINEKLSNRGFLLKDIDEGSYAIIVNYPGYFSIKHVVASSVKDIPEDKESYTYTKTLILKPIVEGKEIVLENILYDFNKFNIRNDAKPSLIELASLLTENPEINIELSSHTDCRGPDKYNMTLSQNRAQSAVDFILELGIDPKRINAKGYGEELPISNCSCNDCGEEEHQSNRRTSFKIVGFGG